MSATVPTTFTAIDKFSSIMNRMGNSATSFAGRAEAGVMRADRALRKLTPGLGEAQKQFLSFASAAAVTGALISGIHFSYESIKEYDKAVGSLLAVTGLTKEQFVPFKAEIADVAKTTKESSIDVAKAFETIGSANSSLLSSASAMGAMSKAAITLSQAAGDDLQATAGNLVGVMNQFGLGAESANRAMNVLAAGTKVGAATIPQVADSMKNFGAVANGANISIEQSVALVEVLGTKSIFASEAGNKLKGSILLLQKAGVGYKNGQFNINEALEEAKAKIDKLDSAKKRDAAITKMFGAENVVTGKILLDNIGLFKKWTGEVTGTNEATIQAQKNNDTLSKALDQLSAAWVNMLTGSEKVSSGLETVKNVAKWVANNIESIVTFTTYAVGAFLAWKAIVLTTSIVMGIYNIVVGITAFSQGRLTKAVATNSIALGAYRFATGAATAANWLFNASNPVGWIIILVTLIAVAIAKYNEWGAALTFILGPFGMIINLIQSFRRNWDGIVSAFKEGGLVAGFKAIGAAILDSLLMPLQQVLGIVAKVTGAEWATKAVEGIERFRKDLNVNTTTEENGDERKNVPVVSTKNEQQDAMTKMFQSYKASVAINVNDPNGRTTTTTDNDFVKVKTKSTMGRGPG